MKKLNTRGFSHDLLAVGFVVIFAISGVAYLVYSSANTCQPVSGVLVSGVPASPVSCPSSGPVTPPATPSTSAPAPGAGAQTASPSTRSTTSSTTSTSKTTSPAAATTATTYAAPATVKFAGSCTVSSISKQKGVVKPVVTITNVGTDPFTPKFSIAEAVKSKNRTSKSNSIRVLKQLGPGKTTKLYLSHSRKATNLSRQINVKSTVPAFSCIATFK